MPALTDIDSRVYGDEASSSDRWYALRELVRVECRRLLLHPIVLGGAVLSGLLLSTLNTSQLPELGRFSTYSGLGLAPLAAAAVMGAHLNTSRARRDDTHMAFAALSLSPTHRTLGHLTAAVAPAVLAAAMAAVYFVVLLASDASGSVWLAEAAVGVAVVFLGGVVGTVAGMWVPSRIGGLLAVAALGGFQVVLQEMPGTLHWLALWRTVPDHVGSDLWIRPSFSHLLYVLALAGLGWAVAVYRTAPRLGGFSAVAAVAVVVATGASQLAPPSEQQIEAVFAQLEAGEQFHVCNRRDNVGYCLFGPYTGWAGHWQSLVAGVLSPVPDRQHPDIVVSQQRYPMPEQLIDELTGQRADDATFRGEALRLARVPGHTGQQTEGRPIQVRESWLRQPADDLAFSMAVAVRAVGLPTQMTLVEPPVDRSEPMPPQPGTATGTPLPDKRPQLIPVACHAGGQARAVVALWLASHTNDLRSALPRPDVNAAQTVTAFTVDEQSYGYVQWIHYDPSTLTSLPGNFPVRWGQAELDLAHQLLALPDGEVAAAVTDNWLRWTDPQTPSEALVDHFDLDAPMTVAEQLEGIGLDPAEHPDIVDAYPNEHHPQGTLAPSPRMPVCS